MKLPKVMKHGLKDPHMLTEDDEARKAVKSSMKHYK